MSFIVRAARLDDLAALYQMAKSTGGGFTNLPPDRPTLKAKLARALIRGTVEALGLGGTTRIFRRDATRLGAAHPVEPFSLVFLDPPYRKGLAEAALVAARDGGWLAADALIVVEEAKDAKLVPPPGFAELERRAYDDTELVFLRMANGE